MEQTACPNHQKLSPGGKPLCNLDKVVVAFNPLLLPRKDSGGVHDCDFLEEPGRTLRALEPVREKIGMEVIRDVTRTIRLWWKLELCREGKRGREKKGWRGVDSLLLLRPPATQPLDPLPLDPP